MPLAFRPPFDAWPRRLVNKWDLVAFPVVLGTLALLAWGGSQMAVPYEMGATIKISLSASELPYYVLRTVLRMIAALGLSLTFSLVYATLAAKSPALEKLLIPLLDILQSVPILGYLSITVTAFVALAPGSLLGVEMASIFAIFTSQAWNMTFSLYQSLRSIPKDLSEAATMYRLSAWQRFWRLEVPFAMPGLIWNAMMSVSGGWFFVVASEAITVSNKSVMLPGVGSYIAMAIAHRNIEAVLLAILAMALTILLYDQLFFRPLVAWADKFRIDTNASEDAPQSWVLTVLHRTRALKKLAALPELAGDVNMRLFAIPLDRNVQPLDAPPPPAWQSRLWNLFLGLLAVGGAAMLVWFVTREVPLPEVLRVFGLGLITLLRIIVLIVLASLIWVPVGLWIGLHPKVSRIAQPLAQILSAFPANLLFPPAVILILHFHLNAEIWTSPLLILGTQWYILFNVVAGASMIPTDLRQAAANLGLKGVLRWRKMLLPAIFPHLITGAVTASGGSWNASIVAEVVSWGSTTLAVNGIGSYIAQQTAHGDFPRIALGIGVMCLFVITINRVLWRRLYELAADRIRLD